MSGCRRLQIAPVDPCRGRKGAEKIDVFLVGDLSAKPFIRCNRAGIAGDDPKMCAVPAGLAQPLCSCLHQPLPQPLRPACRVYMQIVDIRHIPVPDRDEPSQPKPILILGHQNHIASG